MSTYLRLTKTLILLAFLTITGNAQVTKADYARADSSEQWNKLVLHGAISPVWFEKTHSFWYKVLTEKGKEYFLVDAQKAAKSELFDLEKLAKALSDASKIAYKPYELDITGIKADSGMKTTTFIVDSQKWQLCFADYSLKALERLQPETPEDWHTSIDELSNPPVASPDSNWLAFIKNYNVFIRNRKTAEAFQLSYDGSAGEFYSSFMEWSPNSKFLALNKVRDYKKKYISFVESSPKSQLQPILHTVEYLKPGDALPIKQPSLFDIDGKRQIAVNTHPFENQFDLSNLKWCKDSRAFTFDYNQRGHQVFQVVEVATNGATKILVDEASSTFYEYSGKYFRYDVNDGAEIIWASERDGWNHLYLFDGKTGKVKNQITKGNWVVRGVEYVNEKKRTILFTAGGLNANEDPYFVHYCQINLDGTGFVDLTPETQNHEAAFSADFNYFVDSYSTVSQPYTSVLRDSAGKALLTLEKSDITALLKKGFRMPESFVAKGRDGKTDIWGNIIRPSNFDSTKIYPIVEFIYAGPQGAFAQKSFRASFYPYTGLAELGFIVVQMDGMGTSHRSKAFHDVCFKNLKDAGFPDRILWIKAAASKYHYMDTTRVGIFGGSAGGQNALGALLFHPEIYKAAVASCGCHDNRMDKMWWNEQWMGYPIGPQYKECSNVENAAKLKGQLLLIVGEVDDNVDPASTMQVVNALVNANKTFDLLVMPGFNHTSGGKYGERRRRDFFVKNLLKQSPPDWNKE